MSTTNLVAVQQQIQKFWAPMLMQELRESLLLGSLVNRDYEGQIKEQGDEVTISQINAATGELRTVGVDADEFETETMVLESVKVKADKRAVASFKITNLARLQSQLATPNAESDVRQSLMFAIMRQVNDYLYSLCSPSSAAPDHLLNSVATMDATQLGAIRTLAARARWGKSKGWYGLMDPGYYGNVLAAQTLTSSDYVGGDLPTIAGQVANKRFGFNLLEDDSRNGGALFFHPDFMHLVMQQEPQFKLSDLHVNKEFAYLLSVDMIFGAKQGIDGNLKHIVATTAASGTFPPKA